MHTSTNYTYIHLVMFVHTAVPVKIRYHICYKVHHCRVAVLPVGRQERATALAVGIIVVSFFVIRHTFRHPTMVEIFTWKKLPGTKVRIFLEMWWPSHFSFLFPYKPSYINVQTYINQSSLLHFPPVHLVLVTHNCVRNCKGRFHFIINGKTLLTFPVRERYCFGLVFDPPVNFRQPFSKVRALQSFQNSGS